MLLRKTKMKKLFIPIVSMLALASLVGCNNKTDYSDLKIVSPSGAPALALYDIYAQDNVEINKDANNVAAYLSENSDKDIVIAPTNLVAAKVMKAGAPFKLAAVITFGNFYIASTGNDDNDTFDKDDYVVLFQEKGLPDKLFQYVYGTDYSNVHYVNAASDAAATLISGKNAGDNNASVDYVLLAQPALTPALQKAKTNREAVADKIKVIKNVQTDYTTKTGDASFTQASIYIKNTDDAKKIEKINTFLKDTENKINKILEDQTDLDTKLGSLEDTELSSRFGAPNLTILKKVVKENSLNLGYKTAKEEKEAIDKFLKNLGFTNEDTKEELYW